MESTVNQSTVKQSTVNQKVLSHDQILVIENEKLKEENERLKEENSRLNQKYNELLEESETFSDLLEGMKEGTAERIAEIEQKVWASGLNIALLISTVRINTITLQLLCPVISISQIEKEDRDAMFRDVNSVIKNNKEIIKEIEKKESKRKCTS